MKFTNYRSNKNWRGFPTFKSIFGRMFLTYVVILVVIFTTIIVSMSALFSHFNEKKAIESLNSVAKTIEDWTVALQVEQHDEMSMLAYCRYLETWSKYTNSEILIVNRTGEVFDYTGRVKSVPQRVLNNIDSGRVVTFKSDFDNAYDERVLSISYPMRYKNTQIGAIVFNKSLPAMRSTVFEMIMMFSMASLASLIMSFIIVYFQAKKISKPIVQLNHAAQNIAKGDFSERVEVTSHDEIGQLSSTFNFMASSIEKSDKSRQRFISDVSHEIRTPMTSITGFVEGMLDGTIKEEDRNDYLKIVRDESVRLTKLVNDMLEMSKLQSEDYKINIAPFDINNLICLSLISLEKKLEEENKDVDVDFRVEQLMTLGDKDQIQRVLINLLDNAIKFSLPNTKITVKTSIEKGKAHIAISNIGDKIEQEDLKYIFDRFYKTDKSRECDRTGSGLGLSFVKNILRLHNQTVTVKNEKNENDDNYTTTFEFTLELK